MLLNIILIRYSEDDIYNISNRLCQINIKPCVIFFKLCFNVIFCSRWVIYKKLLWKRFCKQGKIKLKIIFRLVPLL